MAARHNLKPCPFCGAPAQVKNNPLWKKKWTVECTRRHKGCAMNTRTNYTFKKLIAVGEWNTRA